MNPPTLFLMLGYPGAGKTTVSKMIAEQTGAVHIWADHERRAMFVEPTHSKDESDQLYQQLNQETDRLLSQGKSVVFDTSFNHYTDRQLMRDIAKKHSAKTVLLWLCTPRALAKTRATHIQHATHNKYSSAMTAEEFDRIADHLEPPQPGEAFLKIDGTSLAAPVIAERLATLL